MIRRAYGPAFADDEIEDVYASAWAGTLRALETRQSSMDEEDVRRYVFTAVARQAGKELRRRRRRPTAPLERAASAVDPSTPPDERADQREQSQITRDLLSSLPRRRRAVLLLRYGWGLEPAQVCALIDGLSPRAYRKEITRGVDELTDKMRTLREGDWCAEREPVLKAYAAGIADAEQERQAQYHLSHCRPCAEFVGKLSGHLHDLGGAVSIPAIDLAADGRVSVPDRLDSLTESARDALSGPLASGQASAESALSTLSASAPRGAGAAGAGLVAKLAGVGAASKAALACVTGGAVATVCVVAGVGPGVDPIRDARNERAVSSKPAPAYEPGVRSILPSQVGSIRTPPAFKEPVPAPPDSPAPPPVDATPPPPEPPAVTPEAQQFGDPVTPPADSTESGGDGDSGHVAAQEFGP
jgi:RNA polymerase sigma factor (sigma-70 family)